MPAQKKRVYVTPSRLPETRQRDIATAVQRAVEVVGLREGPLHADVRINDDGEWVIEADARSIGVC